MHLFPYQTVLPENAPKAVNLFCGAGGSSLGLQRCGYNVVGLDNWKPALDTCEANGLTAVEADLLTLRGGFPEPATLAAVADQWSLTAADLACVAVPAVVDVLWSSPPLQPFSATGRGKGADDPRNGFPATLAWVRTLAPRVVIIENTKALLWKRNRHVLDGVVRDLEGMGYDVIHDVLNAADYGVPQARQRVFIVANRGGAATLPHPTGRQRTLAGALLGLRTVDDIEALPSWAHERPAPTVVGSFCPEVLAKPVWRKKGDVPRQNQPDSVVVTEQEAAMLQGFPEGFEFSGSKSNRWLQIGNAVPPRMAEVLVQAND